MRVIVGTHDNCVTPYIYKVPKRSRPMEIKSGDYAVVENMSGVTLVTVRAVYEVDDTQARYITGNGRVPYQNVLMAIDKEIIDETKEIIKDIESLERRNGNE